MKVGSSKTTCKIRLNANSRATTVKKSLNNGARFVNIHVPAPAKIAKANRPATHSPNGSQACLSDSEGSMVLETAKAR